MPLTPQACYAHEFATPKEQIVCSRSFGEKTTDLDSVSQALERVFRPGHRYHRCGVMLGEFTCTGVTQYGLFDDTPPRPHSERLMQLLDSLNQRGRAIWFGRQDMPERPET